MAKGKASPKILLAEDDVTILQMFSTYLSGEGFTVLQATGGDQALRLIKKESPAVVLLDLMMPQLSGFDVLRAMREDNALKKIPVIVFSNLGQDTDIKKARSLGAKDYLIKSDITPDVVAKKIRQYL